MWQYQYSDELYHYGVLGMKWGVRRYQNPDGTLTAAGKKHKEAAMKGLHEGREMYAQRAKTFKLHTELNKRSLDKVLEEDAAKGETSWASLALKDAYKATGREYVNALSAVEIYDRYIKEYDNDNIKIGEDYVVKNFKTGAVKLTNSGREKEAVIVNDISADFLKRYAKEIKEYAYD